MARYALIQNSIVKNVAEWDGDTTKWQPPTGCTMIQSDTANIGDTWNGTTFVPDTTPPPPDPLAADKTRIRAFMTDIQIDNLITADPATLTTAQQIARKEAIAIRSLVRIVRSDLQS